MITVATYNILHGYYTEQILKNIKLLINKNTDIICLQEADLSFENTLNNFLRNLTVTSWRVNYIHNTIAGNVAIMWDSSKLKSENFEITLLPQSPTSVFTQILIKKLRGHFTHFQRVAMTGTFSIENKTIRVTSTH